MVTVSFYLWIKILWSDFTWEVRKHNSNSVFILKKIGCGIHILKLVGPSECHLLDFVKTSISPKVISVTHVACVLFYWSLETTVLELKEKYRNIPGMYLYTIVHSLMRSVYLLAIHRANLLVMKRVPNASRRCLFAQMSICIHSLRS